MNFLQRAALRMAVKLSGKSLKDPALAEWFGGAQSTAGQTVTPATALSVAAVFACIRVLAESVAALPFPVYRRGQNDTKEKDRDHPLYDLLNRRPNSWQTPFQFREIQVVHMALRGNFYAFKDEGADGVTHQLIPLKAGSVRPFWVRPGVPAYAWRGDTGVEHTLLQHEVHHVPFFPSDDLLTGLSPISLHRETIGQAMAQQEFGSRFFSNDARPGGVIESPDVLDDESIAAFRDYWEKMHRGVANAHRTAILEAGMKWHQVTIAPEDAQYIESRKFSITDIARIYRVPPHLVADLEKATFSNIEHQDLGFAKYTLAPWLCRIEQATERDLFSEAQRRTHFARFNLEGLLRGDFKTRMEGYAIGRTNGWLSANDIRRKEDMNPIADGDLYLVPLNMAPADQVAAAAALAALGTDDKGTRARAITLAAAERVVRKEVQAVTKAYEKHSIDKDADAFRDWLAEFYDGHSAFAAEVLALDATRALAYADRRHLELRAAVDMEVDSDGIAVCPAVRDVLENWQNHGAAELAAEMMEND